MSDALESAVQGAKKEFDRDAPVRWKRLAPFLALAPAAVIAQVLASFAPSAVQSLYSRGLYSLLARLLGLATGSLPFSLAEVAMAGCVLAAAASGAIAIRDVARGRRRPANAAARAGALALAFACAVYGVFVFSWALNHYQLPIAETAGFDASKPAVEELAGLCRSLADEAEDARDMVEKDAAGVMRLTKGASEALSRAGRGFETAAGKHEFMSGRPAVRPKAAAFSPLMSLLGISGFYFPYTGEPHVNVEIPHCSIPHTACHETAHHAGFASEDEANFVGFLACRDHPDPDFRYSGFFTALVYALSALRRADPEKYSEIYGKLDDGLKRDLEALRAFWEKKDSAVSGASRAVNDAYLKTHGKGGGIESYGRFVDLMIGEARKRR